MVSRRSRHVVVGLVAALGSIVMSACGSASGLGQMGQTTPTPAVTPATSGAPAAPVVRYMPLGDSITDGFTVAGGYRTALWTRMVKDDGDKIDFVGSRKTGPATLGDQDNEGHPGWCIDGPCGGNTDELVYPRVHRWMTTYKPDIVSIHLGTNDLKFGASGAVVAYRLDEVIAQIYRDDPGTYVVVATIVPMKDVAKPWADYNRLIPRIATRYQKQGRQIEVADLADSVRQPRDFADSLHPNAEGYTKMANALYPVMNRAYLAES